MLSRFRMTVDDCIEEYKTLGAKVFGNPRPLAKGAIMWHKFDYRTLESAIKEVTQRYNELAEFRDSYEMDEDVCRRCDFQLKPPSTTLISDPPVWFLHTQTALGRTRPTISVHIKLLYSDRRVKDHRVQLEHTAMLRPYQSGK